MKRYWAVQAIVAAGALCSWPLLAQAQQEFGEPGTHLTWRASPPDNASSIDVTYSISGPFTAAQVSLIHQAAAAWSASGAQVNLVEVAAPGSINISMVPLGSPTSTSLTTGPGGFFPDGHPWEQITDATVLFDQFPSSPWWTGAGSPPPGTFDFYSFILREFGTALGLGMANGFDPASVMQPLAPGGERRSLSAGDIAAAQHLYGTPEPATWALFGIGLAGLAVSRKRRARADKVS